VPELLRPPPPITWSDRVRTALEAARERPARVGLAAAGAVVIVVAAALLLRTPSSGSAPALPRADALPSAATTTTTATVVVDVAGAVARPGLVRLPGGSRVADAIDAVGGLLPTADRDRLNLAAPLVDGQRVYVPARGQDVPPDLSSGGSSPSANADAIVDLNTATVDDLDRLPGVGPATAQAILDYRRQHGRFRTIDELLEVRGIGEAKLNQLRPHVRV